MTDCPYCGCPGAFNTGWTLLCQNDLCEHFDVDWWAEQTNKEMRERKDTPRMWQLEDFLPPGIDSD